MEDTLILNREGITGNKNAGTKFQESFKYIERAEAFPIINSLVSEGGEHFSDYLDYQGLGQKSNMLVLSTMHHYYYDHSELENVTILLNLKKLNLINHLDSFLYSVSMVLSPRTNFIGYFSDYKTRKNDRLTSRFYKGFINFLDNKIDTEIDKNDVSNLLVSNGLKVIDMTENNGLTYFRSQINRRSVN
jgi:hypothetical protein